MARNAKSTRNQPTDDFWLNDAEELPRADIPSVGKTSRRVKFYRACLVGSLVLLPVSLLANVAYLPKLAEKPAAAPVSDNQLDSPTKGVAIQAVDRWLAQTPAPLPGGQILSWDGVKIQKSPSTTTDSNGQTTEHQGLELHTLTLVSGTGALFTTQVQVGYSPFRGAQVLGSPTLIPRAPDDKQAWPNLTAWPDLVKVTKTDAMAQAASAWVKAFSSGDPNALRLAVGDTADAHSYVPLVQATASDVQVGDVASVKPVSDAPADAKPKQVVAQVSFAVVWQGQVVGRSDTPSRVTYDVLIDQADTASPKVVAWGGAGTGESLVPFQNAVDGRKITADAIGKAVPSASPSAAPQGSEPSASPLGTGPTSGK
jgi:hypothetical protein